MSTTCTLCVAVVAAVGLSVLPEITIAAGNNNPRLYLEVFSTEDELYIPEGTCGHTPPYPQLLHCYAPKERFTFALVPIHIGYAENGFLGVPYGLTTTGAPVSFIEAVPCPGFALGSGVPPGAVYFGSMQGCRLGRDHPGYLKYYCSSTNLNATYFNIVPNADTGHYKVVNCDSGYDSNTVIGGGAQWGGAQTIVCQEVSTEPTTWGKIKVLFR